MAMEYDTEGVYSRIYLLALLIVYILYETLSRYATLKTIKAMSSSRGYKIYNSDKVHPDHTINGGKAPSISVLSNIRTFFATNNPIRPTNIADKGAKYNDLTLIKRKRGYFGIRDILYIVALVQFTFFALQISMVEFNIFKKDKFDPYSILEIDVNATPKQIKSAYRKWALIYHPDRMDQARFKAKTEKDSLVQPGSTDTIMDVIENAQNEQMDTTSDQIVAPFPKKNRYKLLIQLNTVVRRIPVLNNFVYLIESQLNIPVFAGTLIIDGLPEKDFIEINKAYETLTNPELMKNWVDYGSPDGKKSVSFGVALPDILVRPENSKLIFSLYFLCVMVVIPLFINNFYIISTNINHKTQIFFGSTHLFFKRVLSTHAANDMIDVICLSPEFNTEMLKTKFFKDYKLSPEFDKSASAFAENKVYRGVASEKLHVIEDLLNRMKESITNVNLKLLEELSITNEGFFKFYSTLYPNHPIFDNSSSEHTEYYLVAKTLLLIHLNRQHHLLTAQQLEVLSFVVYKTHLLLNNGIFKVIEARSIRVVDGFLPRFFPLFEEVNKLNAALIHAVNPVVASNAETPISFAIKTLLQLPFINEEGIKRFFAQHANSTKSIDTTAIIDLAKMSVSKRQEIFKLTDEQNEALGTILYNLPVITIQSVFLREMGSEKIYDASILSLNLTLLKIPLGQYLENNAPESKIKPNVIVGIQHESYDPTLDSVYIKKMKKKSTSSNASTTSTGGYSISAIPKDIAPDQANGAGIKAKFGEHLVLNSGNFVCCNYLPFETKESYTLYLVGSRTDLYAAPILIENLEYNIPYDVQTTFQTPDLLNSTGGSPDKEYVEIHKLNIFISNNQYIGIKENTIWAVQESIEYELVKYNSELHAVANSIHPDDLTDNEEDEDHVENDEDADNITDPDSPDKKKTKNKDLKVDSEGEFTDSEEDDE